MWWQIFFFSIYIPEFQAIHISLLSRSQECREKSGSTHIYRDGVPTQAKNYCMAHSSVTSNLQVVNTVQYRICEWAHTLWGECSNTVLFLPFLMHLLQSPCCFWVSYVQHVWRMINRTTPKILCVARLRRPTQSTPPSHPHLKPPICLLQYTHIASPSNATLQSMRSHRRNLAEG